MPSYYNKCFTYDPIPTIRFRIILELKYSLFLNSFFKRETTISSQEIRKCPHLFTRDMWKNINLYVSNVLHTILCSF